MRVFKSNTTRIVIACFIIFMAIPFIFVESSDGVKGGSLSIPMESSANPLSKIIDRIGSFYGFKKKPARASFNKKGQTLASVKRAEKGLPAPSAGVLRAENDSLPDMPFGDVSSSSSSAAGGASVSAGRSPKLPQVKEYIRMDGDTYEVVTDPSGRKFVAMPDGFVPYEKLMADTVSQEEFDAARAQAPHLEDWEIFEALRSPGGLPAYLASGGNNVFYKDGTPGYYDRGGKEGSRLFGVRSGRSGANDEIYDERKLNESISKNSVTLTASSGKGGVSGSVRNKYVEVKKNEPAANNNERTLAELINNNIVIGNETIDVKTASSGKSYKSSASAAAPASVKTLALADKSVNNYMAETMNIQSLSVKGTDGVESEYMWVYPETFKDDKPGSYFYSANEPFFKGKIDNSIFYTSDELYTKNREMIQNIVKDNNLKLKIAMVDGIDEHNKVKAVNKNTFHYQVVQSFLKGTDNSGEEINVKPYEKADTLLIVPDKASLAQLKAAGYNAVLFNKYAITPKDTEAFYVNALLAVEDMAQAKKEGADKKKEVLAKMSDVSNARVGVRGI